MVKPAKILVADHEEKSLFSLERTLKSAGFQTHLVKTGPKTLEYVAKFRPDLCIIDPMLPGIDGFTVSRRLRAKAPRLPIVISTGQYKGEHYRDQAKKKYGVSAYLEKPYSSKDLLDTVRRLLQNKSQRAVLGGETSDLLEDSVENLNLSVAASRGQTSHSNSRPKQTFPSQALGLPLDAGPGMTVQVTPRELQQEMAKVKQEMAQEKTSRRGSPRIKLARGSEAGSSSENQLTSNDIFGSLIDDIEAGRVSDSEYTFSGKNRVTRPPRRRQPSFGKRPAKTEEPPSQGRPSPTPSPQKSGLDLGDGFTATLKSSPAEALKNTQNTQHSGSNEYQLLEKIAAGGMAEVWKGKLIGEKGFEKIVAIKKILSHLGDNEEFISMFIDEAKVAANLTHPNIAQIYELGKIGDTFFIAMEYVSGHTLRTILNQLNSMDLKMAPQVAVFIGMKLSNALHYAHGKKGYNNEPLNIVHRDVSPQNILISSEGEIKLVDFGIAKASNKATQTVAGSLKGKLLYMSPEQADGKAIDNRSDIFSLAGVLYEAVTGHKLFKGESELSVLKQVRNANFEPPRVVNPKIPIRVETILLKALTETPEARYRTAKAMGDELKAYLQHQKIHINESDVADYIKLIANKDRARLEVFGGPFIRIEEPPAPTPPPPAVRLEQPQRRPEQLLPPVPEQAGKGKPLFLIAAVALIAAFVLGWWWLGTGSRADHLPENPGPAAITNGQPSALEPVNQDPPLEKNSEKKLQLLMDDARIQEEISNQLQNDEELNQLREERRKKMEELERLKKEK